MSEQCDDILSLITEARAERIPRGSSRDSPLVACGDGCVRNCAEVVWRGRGAEVDSEGGLRLSCGPMMDPPEARDAALDDRRRRAVLGAVMRRPCFLSSRREERST